VLRLAIYNSLVTDVNYEDATEITLDELADVGTNKNRIISSLAADHLFEQTQIGSNKSNEMMFMNPIYMAQTGPVAGSFSSILDDDTSKFAASSGFEEKKPKNKPKSQRKWRDTILSLCDFRSKKHIAVLAAVLVLIVVGVVVGTLFWKSSSASTGPSRSISNNQNPCIFENATKTYTCASKQLTAVPVGIPPDTIALILNENRITEIEAIRISHLVILETLILSKNLRESHSFATTLLDHGIIFAL
jgi:hypothetical protein